MLCPPTPFIAHYLQRHELQRYDDATRKLKGVQMFVLLGEQNGTMSSHDVGIRLSANIVDLLSSVLNTGFLQNHRKRLDSGILVTIKQTSKCQNLFPMEAGVT